MSRIRVLGTSHWRGWLVLAFLASVALARPSGQTQVAARDTRVLQAAKKGDLAAVQSLIKLRVDVNGTDGDGSTALLWAAHHGNFDMARSLITAGANVNAANRLGVSPLLEASRIGTTSIIDALLKAGADPNAAQPEGETPLMAASGSGNVDAVKLFIAHGADVNTKEKVQNQTALMWAAAEGHVQVIEALLAAGANPNVVAKPSSLSRVATGEAGGRMWVDHASGGLTAVMFAARQGQLEATKRLADAGADLNHANPDGLTAMILAVINDHADVAGVLLDKGANPNDGSLYEAIQIHNLRTNETAGEATRPRPWHQNTLTPLDLIARMLEHGADPNRPAIHTLHLDGTGGAGGGGGAGSGPNETPFARALRAQDVAALRLLLAKGADANQAAAGVPPLATAVGGGGGGRGGFAGGFGAQPAQFRYASERTPLGTVQALLEAGADVNGLTPTGDTALHAAAQSGNVAMIQLLADRGAKLDLQNKAGLTPLDLAMGKQPPPGANAAPGGGGRGGGSGGGGARGGRGGGGPQPQVIALLRQLMGLPPLSPAEMPGAPAQRGGPPAGSQ